MTFLSGIFLSIWAFVKDNYLPLILLLIPAAIWIWRIFKKEKAIETQNVELQSDQIQDSAIHEYVPLNEVILELEENEKAADSPRNMAPEFGLESDEPIANYYIGKYLKRNLFGNKINHGVPQQEKAKILMEELPYPSGGTHFSIWASGNVTSTFKTGSGRSHSNPLPSL